MPSYFVSWKLKVSYRGKDVSMAPVKGEPFIPPRFLLIGYQETRSKPFGNRESGRKIPQSELKSISM